VQPLQRGRGVDAGPRLERRERVDLQEVDPPVLRDAEVDAAQVSDAQHAEDRRRLLLEALLLRAGQLRRGTHAHGLLESRLQLEVVDGVAPGAGDRWIDHVLDRLEHPVPLRRRLLQIGHRHVAAGDELLDQDARGVAGERPAAPRECWRVVHVESGDALRAALEVRLHHDRVAQGVRLELGRPLHELPAGRRDPVLRQDELRELLVERHRQRVGVGPGV
jgi:hypothetical protein